MRNSKTEDTLCLLGGALLGAAAMYMLDPEMGKRRRQRAAAMAGDVWENAGDYLTDTWDVVRDRATDLRDRASDIAGQAADRAQRFARGASDQSEAAQDFGSRVSRRARRLGSRLSDRASDLMDTASDYASDTGDRASSWIDSARKAVSKIYGRASDVASDYAEDAPSWGSRIKDRVSHWTGKAADLAKDYTPSFRSASKRASKSARKISRRMGHDEGFGAPSMIGTAITCCAIGGVTMYFFDPVRGRARRAWCEDKLASFFRRTGQTMRATGQDMANRMRGIGYEAKSMMTKRGQKIDSETLANRVRTELGRCCSHPRLVQVMADADGSITVSGLILRSEADPLLTRVAKVPGVCQIINRLDLRDELTDREISQWGQTRQSAVPQL